MQNLILFLLRFGGFFFFLLFELISFYLVVQNNNDQRDIFFNTTETASNYLQKKTGSIYRYFRLSEFADSLSHENAKLRNSLKTSKYSTDFVIDTVSDKSLLQKFTFTPAHIIANSIDKKYNYLTLDKGTEQGIKKHSGVINGSGVVGIITDVSKHYSRVMSLLNKKTMISTAIKRSGFFGTLIWTGEGTQDFKLINIPKHADLLKGDTLQTSGYSSMFPKGIDIGIITNFKIDPGSNFFDIDVKLFNDLSRAEYVYIVTNIFREELNELEAEENE